MYLASKWYAAYLQSENNIILIGYYDLNKKSTPLPHKTIAGFGWIWKHKLLVTPEFDRA